MAITSHDRKYLNKSGLAAVQRATDDWNRAHARGDKAGMQRAAAAAARVRASNSYQASGGSGYTTQADGSYASHISSTRPTRLKPSGPTNVRRPNPVGPRTYSSPTFASYDSGSRNNVSRPNISSPVVAPTPSGPKNYVSPSNLQGGNKQTPFTSKFGGRDIAAELIATILSDGPTDYDKINRLAAERDKKIASDPSKYSQFESTQSIIDRYMPSKKPEIPNLNFDIERQKWELEQQKWQMEMEKQKQEMEKMMNQAPDKLIELLQDMLTPQDGGGGLIPRMSFDEAKSRASQELNPMYTDAARKLEEGINADMERRGLYNSPLAAGIVGEKQGKLSNEQVAAIAERANTLIQNDASLSLQEKQIQTNSLNNLLNSLLNREHNMAQLMGSYRGMPTLAGRQQQIDKNLAEGNLTGVYRGTPTLAYQKYQTDSDLAYKKYLAEKALSEGNLTGYYKGAPTLARQQHEMNSRIAEGELTGKYNGQPTLAAMNSQIESALKSISVMGKVTTQQQADLLGVPIGTPSQAAYQAAQELQQQMEMFNRELGYKQSMAYFGGSGGSGGGSGSGGSGNPLDTFKQDMIVWETTGSAPDTPAMRYYNIAPGTPFNKETAQNKLEQAKAELELGAVEEERRHQGRVSNFMNFYGVNRSTAEAATLIFDQSDSVDQALQMLQGNAQALVSEGVNISSLQNMINKYYGVREKMMGGHSKF